MILMILGKQTGEGKGHKTSSTGKSTVDPERIERDNPIFRHRE